MEKQIAYLEISAFLITPQAKFVGYRTTPSRLINISVQTIIKSYIVYVCKNVNRVFIYFPYTRKRIL